MDRRFMLVLLLAGLGCGGGFDSGLEPGRYLESLSTTEKEQLCRYLDEVAPVDGEYVCVGGNRTIMRDHARCTRADRYWGGQQEECTVAAVEACMQVLGDAGTWCGLDLLGPCEIANTCNFDDPWR